MNRALCNDCGDVIDLDNPQEHKCINARRTRPELFMRVAHLFAEQSTCLRGHIGAVIVQDKRIVSTGYNGAPPGEPHCLDVGCLPGPDGGCVRTIHAEMNAILWAGRAGIPLLGAVLYTTDSPCVRCSQAILGAGIRHVWYHREYRITEGLELLTRAGIEVHKFDA